MESPFKLCPFNLARLLTLAMALPIRMPSPALEGRPCSLPPSPPLLAVKSPPELADPRAPLFSPGLSLHGVAMQLLSSQYHCASREWRTAEASFKALNVDDCTCRLLECAACFESHLAIAVPDNPPAFAVRPPGHTETVGRSEVHRFVLCESVARAVNAPLHDKGTAMYGEGGGIHRSNIGGFHSKETMFSSASSSEWFGKLHNVLLEALKMIEHGSAAVQGPSLRSSPVLSRAQISGWMNVSRAADFNTLHDHVKAARPKPPAQELEPIIASTRAVG
jgi:hypothetical protein